MYQIRERLEKHPVNKFETNKISRIIDGIVYRAEPSDVIEFLNEFDRVTPLNPKNELHFETGKELLLTIIKSN